MAKTPSRRCFIIGPPRMRRRECRKVLPPRLARSSPSPSTALGRSRIYAGRSGLRRGLNGRVRTMVAAEPVDGAMAVDDRSGAAGDERRVGLADRTLVEREIPTPQRQAAQLNWAEPC